ncbi:MAG: sporulation integral membrane protein YtvI [Lachnospiraceae bacterium]|nr:sporulation integral membrane protein YtvI [Lachnospiraceae bacterium]
MPSPWKNAELYVKAVLNLIIFGIAIVAVIFIVPRAFIFFMPFVIGSIIAWIAGPIVRFCERKFRLRHKTSTAIVIIVVIGLIITLAYFLGVWLTNQVIAFIGEWPLMWIGIQREVAAMSSRLTIVVNQLPEDLRKTLLELPMNMGQYFSDMVTAISVPTFEAVGRFAQNLPVILINIIMCLLSAYFFIAERDYFHSLMRRMPGTIAAKIDLVMQSLKDSIGGYIKAQLKIEVWIYMIFVIGFLILDIEYGFLIAFVIAFLDLLPILGAGIVLVPWAVVKLFNADYFSAIGLFIISIVAMVVRQIIQPKIMGDTIGVPPIPTLFLLYLGFRLAGLFGMIIALPVGIIVINLYQAGVFEGTKRSLRIIIGGINRFRKL